MRLHFSEDGRARARSAVAGFTDDHVQQMYVEGLLRQAGDNRAGRTTFPPHEFFTDSCMCRGCWGVCFEIVREEYLSRFCQT